MCNQLRNRLDNQLYFVNKVQRVSLCVQKEQLVLMENERRKELEEVTKKRQGELKAKLEKAGVRPLEMERKLDAVLDR